MTLETLSHTLTILVLGTSVVYATVKVVRTIWLKIGKNPILAIVLVALVVVAGAIPILMQIVSLRGSQLEHYTWHQGSPAVKMIKATEGLCYLTAVTGHFAGGGEKVKIYREDGFWVLGGFSHKQGIEADATCWVFPSPLKH